MARWEKTLSIVTFAYVIGYMVFFFSVVMRRETEPIDLLPWHLLGMGCSFTLMVTIIRDIYLRSFPNPNSKINWVLAVIFLWPIIPYYLWKYGFRPRNAAGYEPAPAT